MSGKGSGKTLQDAGLGGRRSPWSLPGPCDAPGWPVQGRTWDVSDVGPEGGWAARRKRCARGGLGTCLGEM